MPFDEAGVVPDIIMNPHGFPSRMTVGKMVEMIAAKAAAIDGHRRYGTVFGEASENADKVDDCCRVLAANGYNYEGTAKLTNGMNGKTLSARVFMGPVYYQRLRHMVVDKIQARARGPITALTRQPTEGKANHG